jgi:hypothetical protein
VANADGVEVPRGVPRGGVTVVGLDGVIGKGTVPAWSRLRPSKS